MTAAPRESLIRKHLADRLDLLEPGLHLFRQEYWIPNRHGTSGYIDILARDRHQNWVVIELKRAKKSARETAQELTKYVELLLREKGVLPGRIRAMVVALEPQWTELLTPLSNLARDWEHDLRGYRLTVDHDGVPQSAARVELLDAPAEQRLTSIHIVFLFDDIAERDRCWNTVVESAAQARVTDLVGVHLDYGGVSDRIIYPYALYLAFGRVDPPGPLDDHHPCARSCRHALLDTEERDEYEHPDEYDALTHVCSQIRTGDMENAGPDTFSQLTLEQDWEIAKIHTAGIFSHDTYQDTDIIRLLRGNDGGAKILFHGTASTKTAGPWREFRQSAMTCLATNNDWTELLGAWLDRLTEFTDEYDVELSIYNPCDIISTLLHGLPNNLHKYQPFVLGVAEPRNSRSATHILRGALGWNGLPIPNLIRWTQFVYPDAFSWYAAQYGGIVHQTDQQLLQYWGIRHLVEEITLDPAAPDNQIPDARVRFPSSIAAEELDEWTLVLPLKEFIEDHRQDVTQLVHAFKAMAG